MPELSPAQHARMDQASAAARDIIAPLGGRLVDSRDALLTVVVDKTGYVRLQVTTTDLRWVADALQTLATGADERATEAGQ